MKHEDPEKLKKDVLKWAINHRHGPYQATLDLVTGGLSYSLALQLTNGSYKSSPKRRVIEAIKKVMGK